MNILLLYYSRHGHVAALARQLAQGIQQAGAEAVVRLIPGSEGDAPYATVDDLRRCHGLMLGSPGYFGSMAAPVKDFLDSCTPLWLDGCLIGKAASVFCATDSQHGGNETVLHHLSVPLLHLGMVLVPVPYSIAALHDTRTGGSPYGPTHVACHSNSNQLSDDESRLCLAHARHFVAIARKLMTAP